MCVVPFERDLHLDVLVCETRDGQIRSERAGKLTHHTSGSQPKPKGKMKADWSGKGWWDIPDDGLMLRSHLFACLLHKIARDEVWLEERGLVRVNT